MFEAKQLTEHGKIYLEAANLLELKDWCQGMAADIKDRVCMAEALHRAVFGYQERARPCSHPNPLRWRPVYDALSNFIGQDVIKWNDIDGRTKAEVIEKLREAAYNPILEPVT